MTDEYRPLLRNLVKCLHEASECIERVPEGNEFKAIAIQLESLKLILDENADALLLWMDEGGAYKNLQANLRICG